MLLRALLLASFTLLAACQPSAPQLIFVGGPILTVDPEDRVVEALAVQDGRILATGSRQQILALAQRLPNRLIITMSETGQIHCAREQGAEGRVFVCGDQPR